MGGLWVDYNLMSNLQGLFIIGEANFSDHGANRLGASALMQGLADGYFIVPHSVGNYLASTNLETININHPQFIEDIKSTNEFCTQMLDIKGTHTVDEIHKNLGKIMWDYVGMSRNQKGLNFAIDEIEKLKTQFYNDINIPTGSGFNMELEKAGRLSDFLELGQLMALDALKREESCGGHFREEFQTDENEALRNDEQFAYVAAWGYNRDISNSNLNKEILEFNNVKLTTRSYK
tara:strand:- start:977 stop:1678 length:702 start_codon:yes stop_codon:yes gene_type:complete